MGFGGPLNIKFKILLYEKSVLGLHDEDGWLHRMSSNLLRCCSTLLRFEFHSNRPLDQFRTVTHVLRRHTHVPRVS